MHQNVRPIQHDSGRPNAVRKTLLNLSDRSFQMEWVGRCRKGLQQLARSRDEKKAWREGVAAVLMALAWATQGVDAKQPLAPSRPHERNLE
jgi:hypothetical protein